MEKHEHGKGRKGGFRLWLIVIPCTYVALLLVLSYPALDLAFGETPEGKPLWPSSWGSVVTAFSSPDNDPLTMNPWLYAWVVVMVLAQIALLLPAGQPAERPRGRRTLRGAIAASALLASILSAGIVFSLCLAIWGDEFRVFPAGKNPFSWVPDHVAFLFMCGVPIVAGWGLWWFILLKATSKGGGEGFPQRASRFLLAGSALELIVAVPCHVISRQRGDCCAPLGTFCGIAAGVSIALLCCGPALLYLVRDRMRRKTPRVS